MACWPQVCIGIAVAVAFYCLQQAKEKQKTRRAAAGFAEMEDLSPAGFNNPFKRSQIAAVNGRVEPTNPPPVFTVF